MTGAPETQPPRFREEPAAPWSLSGQAVLDRLDSAQDGLTGTEAARRLAETGPNRLAPPAPTPLWRRILSHFQDVLIYILLVSAVLKALLGDWVDFSVILAVAVINAAIGFVQEGRAEKALDGIRAMLSVSAHVHRDGAWAEVDAEDLVPGDVVRLRSGDRIPADLRLLEATALQVDEAALTGESVTAAKRTDPVDADAGIGDRSSMLYSGTLVAAGTGTGVVVSTGGATEIGRIQTMIDEVESLETPLSRTLAAFGKRLAVVILVAAAVMLLVGGVLHDFTGSELVSAAIGFAVAAVPEGLPALVTITLALGVQQMARRRAITRKLPAVEALGSVTTICSDKTGTLTTNEMTARLVRTRAHAYDVSGLGYAPEGEVTLNGAPAPLTAHPDLRALIEVMAECNDARVVRGESGRWELVGEPTEGALRTLGMTAGHDGAEHRRRAVIPFESDTKYMAVLDEAADGSRHVLVKGAPDRILARSTTQTAADGTAEPLNAAFWEAQIDEIGARGLRVLAAARLPAAPDRTRLDPADVGTGLEFLGVVGIVDPPRPEAVTAIAECLRAGIRVKMITGDHAGTAVAIAREMGIVDAAEPRRLTGAELEAMDDAELRQVVRDVDVYARTSPEHKIRIVSALQHHGEVVAMTGDGVNDAPALTQADIGVAMGIKGTEATKDAAEIVLADDNFATIERAVEEGRRIYDNLRKSVLFLLPTNGAQSLVILVAVLFGWTLPLQPVQVLWINMVTAVTLSLALAGEKAESGIMTRPPRAPDAPLLNAEFARRIAVGSVLIGAATMGVFYMETARGVPLAEAQTTAVLMLALGQLAYLFNCRFLNRSSLTPDVLRGNAVIWWSSALLIAFQIFFTYTPFMHDWFATASVGLREWGLTIGFAVVIFLLVEAGKAWERRHARASLSVPDHGPAA
ncbi:cation-translocating P-type ATPase [Streptomyces longispororuber]|uniref:cation-translocating P-type ATPase n=1 Tax=Streptomyces longispororuber TaxID=68230 RepID=UPI00210CA10E|nr:HAD-IC family P-type ATPase [Streptomyces longispororuber]MCQ4209674.1 HAD-IC family P-type ATPase [Streptomyces longispororuber]